MKDALSTLKERGFVKQCTDETAVQALLKHSQMTFYAGFDATAKSLHVGSLMPIMAMAHLQRAGHIPIAIIGGGTTMIGDPSGKTETRKMLTPEEITDNGAGILEQLQRYLKLGEGSGLFINNADWLLDLQYIDFLRDIGRHFRVNEMIKVEAYKMRLDKEDGLSFTEFNYQLLQAYDFLMLFDRHRCMLQVGGNDQWGNIVAGIELIRRMRRAPSYGLTFPLLTTANGQKMGKTEKGAVWLDPNQTSPNDFYQYWRNMDDSDIRQLLGFFTFLPMEEIEDLVSVQGVAINKAKQVLAYEVTKLAHGEEEAKKAQTAAQGVFGSSGGDLTNLPGVEVAAAGIAEGIRIIDLLTSLGVAKTRSDARRLIEQRGITINLKTVESPDLVVTQEHVQDGVILLKKGKKSFYKIVPK